VPSINHSLWNGVHQREMLSLANILARLKNELEDELNAQAVTEENTPVLFLVTFRAAATKLDLADKFNLLGTFLVLPSHKICKFHLIRFKQNHIFRSIEHGCMNE
jgi:hypothetical protein